MREMIDIKVFQRLAIVKNTGFVGSKIHVAAQVINNAHFVTSSFSSFLEAASGIESGILGKNGNFHD